MGIVSARRRLWRSLLAMVALVDLCAANAAWAQNQKQVLVLYPTRRDAQIAVVTERDLPRLLDHGLMEDVDYYSEFIDSTRFSESEYQAALREFLGTKYQRKRFDLIIAMGNVPLEFIDVNRDIARSPVIFVSTRPSSNHIRNSTGVIADYDFRRTLDLALQLQPDLKHVFVVVGGENNRPLETAARAQFELLQPRLDFTYLSNLPTNELEAHVASLPMHSIVYYLIVESDGTRKYFNPLEYLERLAAIANAPVYSWVDSTMNHGIVGGNLKSQTKQVEAVADLAVRVLKGEPADSIPAVRRDLNVAQVDWRQLRRWGISETRVPAGTTVLFRQPGVFEEYGAYILGAIGVIGLQSALIAGLVIQRRRRRRAEEAMRESEQHFRLTADTAPVMIWRSSIDTGCDFFNKPWLDFRGRTMEEEVGNGWTEGVHPSDLANYVNTYVAAFDRREAFRVEYRLRRADGEYRWVLDTGVPRHLPHGTFSGYIGSCIDITERKEAEEALLASEAKLRINHAHIQDLAGRLITAQEVERSRIAREIHDDVSQQMAVLTMELELLRRAEPSQLKKLTGEVLSRAQAIAKTMHDLSHRLHPARLGLLGMVDSLDALRDELSHYGIPVTFSYDNVPAVIPVDLRLCLYRVVQEGLQNAIKHSKARHISVHLQGSGDSLTLSIVDDGTGFDVDASWNKGLGLISMSERLEAIGGSLEIHSAIGAGTRLDITVPLTIASPVAVEVPL